MKLYTADTPNHSPAPVRRAVGVVVIAFNAETTLRACLDSLVSQTLCCEPNAFGIVVVDDASIDSTPQIIAEYCERFPDLFDVITHEKNVGRGGARNSGTNFAAHKYEFIGFVDSDDWVAPEMYATMLSSAKREHAETVLCDYAAAKDDGTILFTFSGEDASLYGGSFSENPRQMFYFGASLCNKLFAYHLFGRDPFPTHIDFEDLSVSYTLGNRSSCIMKVDELFYFYRQHDKGSIMGARDERYFEIFEALEIMLKEFRQAEVSSVVESWLALVCFQHVLLGRMHDVLLVASAAMRKAFLDRAFTFLDTNFPSWKRLVKTSSDILSRYRILATRKWAIRLFTRLAALKK